MREMAVSRAFFICHTQADAQISLLGHCLANLFVRKHEEELYSSRKEALDRASQLVPQGSSDAVCVKETPSGRISSILMLSHWRRSSRQNAAIQRSCVIQDSRRVLKAVPMGHTADSRPSDFTFANMAVQTDGSVPRTSVELPDEMKRSIDSRLFLLEGWF